MQLSISSGYFSLLRSGALILAACACVAAQGSERPGSVGSSSGLSTPGRSAPVVAAPKPAGPVFAAPVAAIPAAATYFRVGEKLRYSISWGRFVNAAYAEMSVLSRGTLNGHDAIELHSRLKTVDLVNAAIIQLDQSRQVFVDPNNGYPFYATKRDKTGLAPKDTSVNYMNGDDTRSFDLLSLIYKAREAGGNGTFMLFEDEKLYTVTLQTGKDERVITQAGQFDTVICDVTSDYLMTQGIKELTINLTTDDDHVPVLFRMKTVRGDFRAALVDRELPASTVTAPVALATPVPLPPVVKPKPTATPYIDDQPLPPELGFELGESLEYNVSVKGVPMAVLTLAAPERRLFQNNDSLRLSASVVKADPAYKIFVTGDQITAYVDPETLAPRYLAASFSGNLGWLNEILTFDERTGSYSVNGGAMTEAPMGTHTVLSLIYAMRSFNLKPSKDPSNPVNDTRVSVFWLKQPYIFTLRPAAPETIVLNGQKVSAQLIRVSTGNAEIDAAAPQVWLSTDSRVPLRFIIGQFQADLVVKTAN